MTQWTNSDSMALIVIIVVVLLSTVLGGYALVVQDDIISQQQYDLNVLQTAFKIQSATLKRVNLDDQMLRQANECLIKYSYRDRCITAIKATPLPKMITK